MVSFFKNWLICSHDNLIDGRVKQDHVKREVEAAVVVVMLVVVEKGYMERQ